MLFLDNLFMILFHSSGYRCLKHFYLEQYRRKINSIENSVMQSVMTPFFCWISFFVMKKAVVSQKICNFAI